MAAFDFYPGGMIMRSMNSSEYRYGFNGMEQDFSIAGDGNHYTTEWRELDTRLGGRWWSPDPVVKPWESPYAGFANNPIYFSDPEGLNPGPSTGGGGNPPVDDKTYDGGTLDEVVITASRTVSNTAKGATANNTVNRYKFFESTGKGNPTVFGIKDMNQGRPGKGDWIFRIDKPHKGADYPHINTNKTYTGVKDPHTPITKTTLRSMEGVGKGLKILNRVATPVAVVVDAARIYAAVEQSHGNIMGKKVIVTASDVAGGWAGAFGGAAVGAQAGAWTGGVIGGFFGGIGAVPGAAIGGFVGGLAGGIGGAIGGSWAGREAADTYYEE
jgi:hypothetical protein